VGRHRNGPAEPDDFDPEQTTRYTPQRLELRTRRAPRAPLWARLCVSFGVIVLLVSGSVYAGTYLLTARYESNIKRADLLGNASRAGQKRAEVKGPMNILVVGSDSRANETYDPSDPSSSAAFVKGERSDTIMLMHLPATMDHGYAISIPRDAYVNIPPVKGRWKGGKDKINAAMGHGGVPHLVKTIQNFSGLTIDHVVIVDFSGLRRITDAVGGVDVYVDKQTVDPYRPNRVFKKGLNTLDGETAEAYVRQRKGLPGNDYDRMKRQQQYLHALMTKITATGVMTDAGKMDDLMLAVTESITVDEGMQVKGLAFALKKLRPSDVTFLTIPMIGGQKIGGVWYEMVDEPGDRALFAAIKGGTMDAYLLQNPPNDVSHGS
jgi:LCP family protein required for cell wall assembly